jgi:hypothetical protein
MTDPKLLVLSNDPFIVADLAWFARKAGFVVMPRRFDESIPDALVRVMPEVILIHTLHEARASEELRREAERLKCCVLLFDIEAGRHRLRVLGKTEERIDLRPGNESALYGVLKAACAA